MNFNLGCLMIFHNKLRCVVRMVVDSILPHAKAGQMTIGKTHSPLGLSLKIVMNMVTPNDKKMNLFIVFV